MNTLRNENQQAIKQIEENYKKNVKKKEIDKTKESFYRMVFCFFYY